MKVLVTGADGFLGSNVVRELLKRNMEVIAFLHPESHHFTLNGIKAKRCFGNILSLDDLLSVSNGCDAVLHTAASTSVWPPRNIMVREVNINGTKNVINACRVNNIKRLIYVSSASVFKHGTYENPGNEQSPFTDIHYGLDYVDSKCIAHKMVVSASNVGLPAIIINPTYMIGPYDAKPSSGKLLINLYKGHCLTMCHDPPNI